MHGADGSFVERENIKVETLEPSETQNQLRGQKTGECTAQPTRPPSLRHNFLWTFVGNAIYAAGQWAILSLFAKLGSSEMLGQYALAVAVTAPVGMLFHLNLRSVLATDTSRQFPFGDYLYVRLGATAVAVVTIAIVAFTSSPDITLALVTLLVGAGLCAEAVSDIFQGAMQRREEMRQVAISMIVRTVATTLALLAILSLTGSLVWAALAMAAARVLVLLVYDRKVGGVGEEFSRTGGRNAWTILRTALPLGIVLMLVSLNTNLPRYAIEEHLGFEALAGFAAVISFVTIGSTMVNALGQSVTARLSRHFRNGERNRFLGILGKMAALVTGIGIAGVICAWLLGDFVLTLLYRPEFASYRELLTLALGASTLSYLAIALGYAVTSARVFDAQIPLFSISALCCGVTSSMLVPQYGLPGAVFAIALAAVLQIVGQVLILIWAFRRRERTA